MGAVDTSTIFSVGANVVKTELAAGDVGKNVVTYKITRVQGDSNGEEAEYWGPFGLASRPPASSGQPDDAAQVLSINMAGDHLIIGGRDHRTNTLYGNLGDGDTALYGGGQGRILIKNNGSVNIFTAKGNADGGSGMGIFVNPDGSITMASHNGAAVTMDTSGNVKMFNKAGAVQVNTDGVKVSSTTKVSISAPAIVLGGAATTGVVTLTEMTTLIAAIATGLTAVGVGTAANGATAATAFTGAAAAVTSALAAKRVSAD